MELGHLYNDDKDIVQQGVVAAVFCLFVWGPEGVHKIIREDSPGLNRSMEQPEHEDFMGEIRHGWRRSREITRMAGPELLIHLEFMCSPTV